MMNMKQTLSVIAMQNDLDPNILQFPDCEVNPANIKVVMINEVVPKNPNDWFYSDSPDPENKKTAFGLFEGAGVHVKSMRDVLNMGIYITTALKTPKEGYTADPDALKAQLPLLEITKSLSEKGLTTVQLSV